MTVADRIAERISSSLKLSQTQSEIISYGAFALSQIFFSLTLVAIFGWLFGLALQALTVSFTSSILRQYSGGVHASRPSICLIVGTVATVGTAILMVFLSTVLPIWMLLALGGLIYIWATYEIYQRAPVDSPAKPIKTEKKRKRMRRISFIILSFYFVLDLILILSYYLIKDKNFLTYSVCIYGAVGWQIFNLTKVGHTVLKMVDGLLDHMLFRKGGENT